jgi:hypothetical protein
VRALLVDRLHERLQAPAPADTLQRVAGQVSQGQLDAYAAADELQSTLT